MMAENELAIIDDHFAIPDINLPSIIDLKDSVMDLENVPDRAVIIISLRAMGYMPKRIAEMLEIERQTVYDYLQRYDPEGKSKIGKEDRRAITTQMFQSTAAEALLSITHEKLKSSDAKALADIATKCATVVERLNLSKKIGDSISSSRVDSMLDALDVGEG